MLDEKRRELLSSIGLLFMRLSAGWMMIAGHGLGKFHAWGARSATFSDPLGVGSPVSMALAIFGELFCSALVVLGLGTRLTALPVAITMAVAAFLVHGGDPMFQFQAKALGKAASKEFALIYMIPFLTLVFTGPGRFSLDALIQRKLASRSS